MTRSKQSLLREEPAAIRSRPLRKANHAQPDLPFDPMPERIEPCLALLKPSVPEGPDWLFEVKWDGYRLALHIEGDTVRVLTRGGHDWTHRFPTIVAAAKALGVNSAILDGEAVVLDEQGRSDFSALQRSLGGRGGKRTSVEAIFYAFDLLYLDGYDLCDTELSVRRHLLEDVVPRELDGDIRLSQEMEIAADTLLSHACRVGLEGIIAKHRDRPYRSGRTGDWLKIKCIESESFAIIGYERSTSARGGLGSLLLAARRGGEWAYVGAVGTGFTRQTAENLRSALDERATTKPVVPLKGKRMVFVKPTLVAEIEFRGWTGDGSLRHASFKGLREAQDDAAVYELPE
ncbi:ATP-dependent DNA ligase (plasmid) [Neorhizobium sp. SOG26]|uniref:non-homologous end-joining DNA ligase n=1 Tax=Neorhizobium sp. SOG26 TaxID=2060726 RepID=UPI000E56D69F|nr:non-homologous end-joining DNA ligase [Neorhizobium sp. SOG26]AXV17961.1 ATP-dependent DNA ligase [Neorhizobium sp. SOG26]